MDDQLRAKLLLDREKAENQVADLLANLRQRGDDLCRFAQDIRDNPDGVLFANAPEGLGNIPVGMERLPAYDWRSLDVLSQVAKLIQDLRQQRRKLATLEHELQAR